MKKIHTKERGITIITLVITIIILLILAGISIATLVGNDGLINRAKKAKSDYENAQEDELAKLNSILDYSIEDSYLENKEDVSMSDLVSEIIKLKNEVNNLKTANFEDVYPVGSIYISTDLATAEDVAQKLGGTWERYGQGKTLIGVEAGEESEQTGGSKTANLNVDNLPNHTHVIPNLSVSSWTGSHNHHVEAMQAMIPYNITPGALTTSITLGPKMRDGATVDIPAHDTNYQTITVSGQTTNKSNTESTGAGTAFSVQNPYITVYMWKRVN